MALTLDRILKDTQTDITKQKQDHDSAVESVESVESRVETLEDDSSRGGRIIEQLTGPCDGRTLTGQNCSITLANITDGTYMSNTYADVPGSVISYVPPAGTKTVVYEFFYQMSKHSDRVLGHWKFLIDDVEIPTFRETQYIAYSPGRRLSRYVLDIGSVDSPSTGRFLSWDTAKEMKMQCREYSTSHEFQVHKTYYWDGTHSAHLVVPIITITAIS